MSAQLIRGACPGLSTPMQTGDGLLVRLQPKGGIAVEAFIALCALARRHGNGIIEITARGNVQLRGLSLQSATELAVAITDLNVAETCSVPIITNPLADDPHALLNTGTLAGSFRSAIAGARLALAPKVSIVIDDAGRLHLDSIAADVRLRAFASTHGTRLQVALGGDANTATTLGAIAPERATDVVMRLLHVMAPRGAAARASSILRSEGLAPFRSAVETIIEPAPTLPARSPVEIIGQHPLRNGKTALGVALAFGHADAEALAQLALHVGDHRAAILRPAPGRALLLVGLHAEDVARVTTAAGQLGFIIRADDPRRRIAACPGKPACASGWIPARALAAALAEELPSLSHEVDIHISGCAKGCAHPAPTRLTVVGDPRGCGIVVDGSARATPLHHVACENLLAEITPALRLSEARHG